MKCLVTGATGFVGRVLVGELARQGHDVTAFVLPSEAKGLIADASQTVTGDVCDAKSVERAVSGADVVFHLAGVVNIASKHDPVMERVNVGGTRNVVRACLLHGKKMIYVSSVHAIPEKKNGQAMAEVSSFCEGKVQGAYAKTKAQATRMVLAACKDQGLKAMVAHPSGIIGPFEHCLTNIGQLIADFLCGGLMAYVDGRYNFIDVRDVARGLCAMLTHWQPGQCYVLSGEVVEVKELLGIVAQASGKPMLKTKLPYWFVRATAILAEGYYKMLRKKPLFSSYSIKTLRSNCHFSNQKAKQELGFAPLSAKQSLTDMTLWVKAHFTRKKGNRLVQCAFKNSA